MVTPEKKSQNYTERNEAKRAVFMQEINQLDKSKIIYIDEAGMDDNDFYKYAYSKVGERFYEFHPGHRSTRLSMIAGLNEKNINSPLIFDGHCNTEVFETYIEKVLIPNLSPGMVVIIDNASFHKSKKIKILIEAAGCELKYLPPYSPDLNPIEKYWHKIKNAIRKKMRNYTLELKEAMSIVLKELSIC